MRLELDMRFLHRSGIVFTVDDLRLGLSLGIISPPTVVAIAKQSSSELLSVPVFLQLAETDAGAVAEIRELLGAVDPEEATLEPALSVRKWLYLELLATYELRRHLKDPFEFVEEIYADFGYPQSVAPFVRYMPPPAGAAYGLEAMTERWMQYLSHEAAELVAGENIPPSDFG